MIITRSDKEKNAQLRKRLFTEFEMKYFGGLKYFIGIEIFWSRKVVFIFQRKYTLDLLAETGMVWWIGNPVILQ